MDDAYKFTKDKLEDGRQSVYQKAHELIGVGAKENANRRIPKPKNTDLLLDNEESTDQ